MIRSSLFSGVLDAELELRGTDEGAETSSGAGPTFAIPVLGLAYWHGSDDLGGALEIVVDVTEAAFTGDETYLLEVIADDVAAFDDSPVTVARAPITTTGAIRLPIDMRTLQTLDSDFSSGARFITLKWTITGSAPALDFSAHLYRSY